MSETKSTTAGARTQTITSFGALNVGDCFRKREKLNPQEHPWLQKTSKDSAAYCDQTGEVFSNHFLFSRNAEVIRELEAR
jgi:hypothetical protein